MKPAPRYSLPTALVVLLLLAWQGYQAWQHPAPVGNERLQPPDVPDVRAAFEDGLSGIWLQAEGRVLRILRDDEDGSRHQRFILDAGGGQTVLVSHNIDLARRLPLVDGDTVSLRGRYEWNDRGGVIHWTHRDPAGREDGGWIEHGGIRYH